MRIAQVVCIFPPDIGGMGQVVFDECAELSRRGYDVVVFTLSHGQNYSADVNSPFKIVRLNAAISSGPAGWVPELFFRLKNFDIVHLHYPFYGGAEWVWLGKKIRKQKYVLTYHMDAAPSSWIKRLTQKIYDKLLARAILTQAEKILTVDKDYFSESYAFKLVAPEKIDELPNSVDTAVFKPAPTKPSALGLDSYNNKKIILFVGNLLPVKRLDLLIKIWPDLPSEAVLVVVGDGYEEAEYKKMVAADNLNERVRFVGRINDKEKLALYYNAAWCTVVPSDSESFSLVIAESLACGTPVVASDVLGIRARVEPGIDGELFAAGSVVQLQEKLGRILQITREERLKMGERGRSRVFEKYGLEKHVERLLAAYKSL